MKKIHYLIGVLLLILAGYTLDVNAQVSNDNEDEVNKVDQRFAKAYVPGQVLFKLKDGKQANVRRAAGRVQTAGINSLDAVLKEYGVEEIEQLLPNAKVKGTPRRAQAFNGETIAEHDLTQLYKISLSEEKAQDVMQMVEKLNTLDEVEYAEPNYKVYLTDTEIAGIFSGNPYVTQQWYLEDYGVTSLWNKLIVHPTRPVIAIIDTGVDMTHPDLAPNLWTNQAEADGEANYDNDNNGFAGDVHGWDFINNTPNVRDFNMHGTHVAGIAAAANNGIGIIGANPRALIMPVSVMQSDGTGDVATIVKGIDYAVANGATVLNLSLGTYANSRAMRQALERAYQKAVIVAAAGNDGRCINTPHIHLIPPAPMFPAAYSFVLGVQATTSGGGLAGFSNYDDDGNTFSSVTTLQDPDGFNYELKAPGTDMLSTIPGGKYKVLQGTSMASPLVAGSISALLMVKDYLKDDNTVHQEILWGDLLHTNNIAEAYAVSNRPAELDLIKVLYRDKEEATEEKEEDYSNDGRIDAGETVYLYPVIRTTFGRASNIKMYLAMGDEFEDAGTVDIITDINNKVNFGLPLDAYGRGVSLNPLKLTVANNVANGRHIKMKFIATCDETSTIYEGHFTMVVDNMSKISGMITEDMTLTADKQWLVSSNLAIPEGVTLTIEPGTTILLNDGVGMSCSGNFIANGTKEEPITFTKNVGSTMWGKINCNNTISYCVIEYSNLYTPPSTVFDNCTFRYCRMSYPGMKMNYCNIQDSPSSKTFGWDGMNYVRNTNFVNNYSNANMVGSISYQWDLGVNNNMVNTILWNGFLLRFSDSNPITYNFTSLPYMGSSKESLVRQQIYELGTGDSFSWLDLSNMPVEPYGANHGIVWKVCVNGKDAQDEYEDIAPLGVGKQEFKVYFNRPMNVAVAPQVTFGARDPYTQNAVNEDGSWSADSLVYTVYKTITGKTKSDGINRIYVQGAEDNEYFECPYEKTRFNVMINAAGSMATGFAGEAQMGRVELTWNNDENDFDDAMGFNIYRYTIDANEHADTVCINKEIVDIETTEYTDYDVVPGTTYYYMYKVLSTDLKEYDVSNVVAVTPLTSELGDANGSGDVDVADVTTTVNYITGMEAKPFIFEAADMNVDLSIDVLDVIGIIQKILHPSAAPAMTMAEATAVYTIEDGVLYVESPVALGGVQVQINLDGRSKMEDVRVAADLEGFEHASAWLSDYDYLFLAYNMNGKTLSAGKHALLYIGDAEVSSIRLSSAAGKNVTVEGGQGTTNIDAMGSKVMTQKGIYDLQGRKVTTLKKGVYIINGEKVVK